MCGRDRSNIRLDQVRQFGSAPQVFGQSPRTAFDRSEFIGLSQRRAMSPDVGRPSPST
jgi:hypothetical protein